MKINLRYCAFALLIFCSGCSTLVKPVYEPVPERPEPEIVTKDNAGLHRDIWESASGSITKIGFEMLQKGDYAGAIRTLERAVSINPYDGPAYYYLAESWMEEKNFRLARQFNRLAILHLKNSAKWSGMAEHQQNKINNHHDASLYNSR
jgi:tetratricopeptide (TPR) repeat protein